MSNEKKENQMSRDYLNMSYKMADEYSKMAWTDIDTPNIKVEVEERKFIQGGMRQKDKVNDQEAEENADGDKKKDEERDQTKDKTKKSFAEELGLSAPDQK